MPLTIIGSVWVGFALAVTAWPRDITNPTLGPTRLIWEIGGDLIILAERRATEAAGGQLAQGS